MSESDKIQALYDQLLKSDNISFTNKGKRVKITTKHGVYIIYDKNQDVLHVGNTRRGKKGLDQRLNNHRTGTSSFRNNYLIPNRIELNDSYSFKCIEVEKARYRVLLEALTIGKLCPKYIGIGIKNKL